MKTKEVRLCGECGREKPIYPPSPTPGYGPHSFDRDDYCLYCHKSTVTEIKTQKLEQKPSTKPKVVPREPTTKPKTSKLKHKKPFDKSVPTDKYVSKYNTYAKKHPVPIDELIYFDTLRIKLKMPEKEFLEWMVKEVDEIDAIDAEILKQEVKLSKRERQRLRSAVRIQELRKKLREE